MASILLDIDQFLETVKPLLDVRSPAEYENGHIPGAISFPLFTDRERAEIGTLYKKDGKEIAVKRGLEITGPRIVEYIDKAEQLSTDSFRLHCWRGGMRSESISWLLNTAGFETTLLKGGYKAYRNAQFKFFDKDLPLRVVSGFTGTKKTIILNKLRAKGEQVVDLEGIAKHPGSSFGNQKSGEQPTTEQFQNEVFEIFRSFDLSKPIWIEDESIRIGNVNMLESLYQQKSKSPHYVIEASKEQRVQYLVDDYGDISEDRLVYATRSISKKLGKKLADTAIEAIGKGDLYTACDIILKYYDKRYSSSLKRKGAFIEKRINTDLTNLENAIDQLLQ